MLSGQRRVDEQRGAGHGRDKRRRRRRGRGGTAESTSVGTQRRASGPVRLVGFRDECPRRRFGSAEATPLTSCTLKLAGSQSPYVKNGCIIVSIMGFVEIGSPLASWSHRNLKETPFILCFDDFERTLVSGLPRLLYCSLCCMYIY